MTRTLAVLCALLLQGMSAASASEPSEPSWSVVGDVRGGYFGSRTTNRAGVRSETDEARARLRLALRGQLDPRWSVHAGMATRYGSDQTQSSLYLRGYPPERGGTRLGDTTLDRLQLAYQSPDDSWRITVGRMQTRSAMPDLMNKSLDRKNSSNISVNWTDGLHLEVGRLSAWQTHLILQHNHRKGSSSVTRAPLDFSARRSRVSAFISLDNRHPVGPVVQRTLGITWLPQALAPQGIDDPERRDYVILTTKVAAAWPLGQQGQRLIWGLETGYAPIRPDAEVMATGRTGRAGGFAWHTSLTLFDLMPDHNLGIIYGQTEAGWLLSPDFRPNDNTAEIRYQRRFPGAWSFEARYRFREERRIPWDVEQGRRDADVYVRLTGRL